MHARVKDRAHACARIKAVIMQAENRGAAGTTAALPLFLRSPLKLVELRKSGGWSLLSLTFET